MPQKIVIIGAGKIGQAIGHVIAQKPVSLFWWDTQPDTNKPLTPLSSSIPNADIVFICTPSWALREVTKSIAPLLSPQTILVCPSKGLEAITGLTADAVIREEAPHNPVGLLLGSMLADEILKDEPAVAVFASASAPARTVLTDLFSGTRLFLHLTTDVIGAAYASVTKNVYAILMGAVDALGYGDNVKGYLASQALTEMQSLICILGGHKKTCSMAPGAGDFLTTAYSPLSRNRTTGQALINKSPFPKTAEGIVALPLLCKKVESSLGEYPLLRALRSIVAGNGDPKTQITTLLH